MFLFLLELDDLLLAFKSGICVRLRFSSQFCLPSSSDSSLARLLNSESVAQRDSEYVATWGPGSGRNPEFLTGTLTDDSQKELEILHESV